jgi:hypothetical protein
LREEQLQEIEARAAAATPGPWRTRDQRGSNLEQVESVSGWHVGDDFSPQDAAFIAAAREAVPALVAEVRLLRAQLAVRVGDQPGAMQLSGDLATDPQDAQCLGDGPGLSLDDGRDRGLVQAGHAAEVVGGDRAHGGHATGFEDLINLRTGASDAAFVAHGPALVARVRELEVENERLRESHAAEADGSDRYEEELQADLRDAIARAEAAERERDEVRAESRFLGRDNAATLATNEEIRARLAEVEAQAAAMREVLGSVKAIADESDGIVGFHLNGAVERWEDRLLGEIENALAPDAGKALLAERDGLRRLVGCLVSAVKSGEPWTETLQKALDSLQVLAALEGSHA